MLRDSSNPATPQRPPHPKALAPAPQIPARRHPSTARPKFVTPQVSERKNPLILRRRHPAPQLPKRSTAK